MRVLNQDLYFNRSDPHFFNLEFNKSIESESGSDIDVKETLIICDMSYTDSDRSCRALSVYLSDRNKVTYDTNSKV